MPWKETRALDERTRFVLAVEAGDEPMAAVCRRFGISRQNGYKWLERWRGGRRRRAHRPVAAPLNHPQAVAAERCSRRALAVRRAHPTWGPVKVRAVLGRQKPEGWRAVLAGGEHDRRALRP